MKTKIMMMLGFVVLMSACGDGGLQVDTPPQGPTIVQKIDGVLDTSKFPLAQNPIFTLDNAALKMVPTVVWYQLWSTDPGNTSSFGLMFTKEDNWPNSMNLILDLGQQKELSAGSYEASTFTWSYQDDNSYTTPVNGMSGTIRIDDVVFRPISHSDICNQKVVGYVRGHISVHGNITAKVVCPNTPAQHTVKIEGDFVFQIEHMVECQIDYGPQPE